VRSRRYRCGPDGASRGIGAGLTKAYRERGFAVIVTARSIEPSEDAGIVAVEGDIADADTAQRIVDTAIERFGRIDTLINNAGVYIGKPFTDYTVEDLNALIAVNLGVIKTPTHDESSYAGLGALHPVGRVGEIEDVVGGVLYLETASFVTGEVLRIDGGQSAGH
jgi:NAD(P)-dependent dehydrogenase (short-subunit alcohol dehydrogenase family)